MAQAKELSMSPSAVRSRARRAAATPDLHIATAADKPMAVKKEGTKKAVAKKNPAPIKISAANKRSIGQLSAAVASGFLPIASYMMAHVEAKANPILWVLVAAALAFSAPTLAGWATKWCGGKVKAWGFTVLLEGVLVASTTGWLSMTALTILVVINASNAWELAARKEPKAIAI